MGEPETVDAEANAISRGGGDRSAAGSAETYPQEGSTARDGTGCADIRAEYPDAEIESRGRRAPE